MSRHHIRMNGRQLNTSWGQVRSTFRSGSIHAQEVKGCRDAYEGDLCQECAACYAEEPEVFYTIHDGPKICSHCGDRF